MSYRLVNEDGAEVTVDRISILSKEFKANRGAIPFLMYPGSIGIARALVFAYMSGANSYEINAKAFQAACTKFGLDSPVPPITKRLALYGNTEDVIEELNL